MDEGKEGMVKQFAVIRIDSDGTGFPVVCVMKVFTGPESEARKKAFLDKAVRERWEETRPVTVSLTRIRGTVQYMVTEVSDDEQET